MKKWCVYKHLFPDNMMYIGITCNLKQRWSNSGLEYKQSTAMFTAIREFGWRNIKHEILHKGLTKEEAEQYEKKYILQYHTYDPRYGYNLTLGGSSGTIFVKEKIVQYDLKGNKIAEYLNQKEASRQTGIHQSQISAVCLHKIKQVQGFVFRKNEDLFDINNFIHKTKATIGKKIYQVDINKNILNEYNSVQEAAKSIGVHWSSINAALDVGSRRCSEYYWCSKNNYNNFIPQKYTPKGRKIKKIYQYDLNGQYINEYNSMRQASIAIGIGHGQISECIRGIRQSAGGYKWVYAQ